MNPFADILTALDVMLPQTCVLCGSLARRQICAACYADLPWQRNACPQCGINLPLAAELCGECLRHPPYFEATQTLFAYDYPVDKLIQAGKFGDSFHVLQALGNIMAERFSVCQRPDVIIPVPLHPARLRQRGYNQASLLAKPLAKHFGVPLNITACRRIKYKHQQVGLSDKERRRNIRGAFDVREIDPAWRRVVIVDDVMTTGATMNELSKQLLRAGVSHVEAWCCARKN